MTSSRTSLPVLLKASLGGFLCLMLVPFVSACALGAEEASQEMSQEVGQKETSDLVRPPEMNDAPDAPEDAAEDAPKDATGDAPLSAEETLLQAGAGVEESGANETEGALAAEEDSPSESLDEAGLTPEDRALVDEVSAYFNSLTTLAGDFDQQNQDGTLYSGEFYLARPGRMRFEYAPPQQLTLISDGLFVMLNDRELESVDRYPLSDTPLNLILKKKVDLAKDAKIVRVERQGTLIGITAREEDGMAQGDLTLVFAGPRLELRYWMVEDVQGNRTVVSLRNIRRGVEIDPGLFKPEEYEFGIEDGTD